MLNTIGGPSGAPVDFPTPPLAETAGTNASLLCASTARARATSASATLTLGSFFSVRLMAVEREICAEADRAESARPAAPSMRHTRRKGGAMGIRANSVPSWRGRNRRRGPGPVGTPCEHLRDRPGEEAAHPAWCGHERQGPDHFGGHGP